MSIRKVNREKNTINLLSEEERDNKKSKEISLHQEPLLKHPLNNPPVEQQQPSCKQDPEEPKRKRIRGPKETTSGEQISIQVPAPAEEEASQIGVKIKKKDKKRTQKLMEFGSFERGDRINKLEPYRISGDEKERVFRVHWKERKDGTQPKASFADYEELKHQSPFKVIKWWESTWQNARKIVKENDQNEIKRYSQGRDEEQPIQSIIEYSRQTEQPKQVIPQQNLISQIVDQSSQLMEQNINPQKQVNQPTLVGQNKKVPQKQQILKYKQVQIIELENEPVQSQIPLKQTSNELQESSEKPQEIQKEVIQQPAKDDETSDLDLLEKEFLFIPDNPQTQAQNQIQIPEYSLQEIKEPEQQQEFQNQKEISQESGIQKEQDKQKEKEKPQELDITKDKLKPKEQEKLKEKEKTKDIEKQKEKEKSEKPKEIEKFKTNDKYMEVIDLDSPQHQPQFQLHSNSLLDDICEFADKIKSVKIKKNSEEENKQHQEILCAQIPQTQEWEVHDSQQNDDQIDLNIEA